MRRERPMRTVGSSPCASSSYSFERDTPSSYAATGIVSNRTCRASAGSCDARRSTASVAIVSISILTTAAVIGPNADHERRTAVDRD